MAGTKTIHVNRWGNGLGIRLPKEFIDKVGIKETSMVEVTFNNDVLMIRYVKEPRKHISLSERIKNWDGQPYELSVEDRRWINMEPARDEIW